MLVLLIALPLFMVLPVTVLEAERAAGLIIHPTLSEYRIEMPTRLNGAPMTLQVTNTGSLEHGFEIEGEGFERRLQSRLKPGDSRTFQLFLGPGHYTVYCPVGNHRALGMVLSLQILP
jgi:uncharacterized cupredoxin-like copper-binding protein